MIKGKTITSTSRERNTVFWLGITSLLFVPVFKTVTHLPPYMGVLLGLGVMWVINAVIHKDRDVEKKRNNNVSKGHLLNRVFSAF